MDLKENQGLEIKNLLDEIFECQEKLNDSA